MKNIITGFIRTSIKLIGILIGLILFFILTLSIINYTCKKKEAKSLDQAYGQMVEVGGENICVDIKGNGEKVIVLLPGFASISPILEMAPLADKLKDEYTVVTVEPFGYGLSDKTKK